MRPLHLEAFDFGSYSHLYLPWDEVNLAAVVGANGSGKSTLLDAMLVALFGAARGLDACVRDGAEEFSIDFEFLVEGARYKVSREHHVRKGQNASLSTTRTGNGWTPVCEPKVRDVDAAIVDLLGADMSAFILTHHLPQGMLTKFVNMTPSERKTRIAEYVPLKKYKALEQQAKDAHAEFETRLRVAEAYIDEHAEGTVPLEEAASALHVARLNVGRAEAVLAGARAAASEAREQQEARHGYETTLATLKERLEGIDARIAHESGRFVTLSPPAVGIEDAAAAEERALSALTDAKASAEEFSHATIAAENARASFSRKLSAYEDARTALLEFNEQDKPVCAECGQTVEGEHYEAAHKAVLARLEVAREESETAKDALVEADAKVSAVSAPGKTVESCEESLRIARRQHEEAREYEAACGLETEVKANLEELNAQQAAGLKELLDLEAEAPAVVDVADILEHEAKANSAMTACKTEEAKAAAEYEQAREVSEQLEAKRQQVRELSTLLTDLNLLVKAYGKSGIQARLLESAVQTVEDAANSFLAQFAEGFSLELRMQRDNKGGGKREVLDIIVTDSSGTRPLERYSGGETTRIAFALAAGLSEFVARNSSVEVGSFVVDEPEYLDPAGVNDLVACLQALSQTIPCVVLVSHVDGIADALPQRIEVTKGANGVSAAVVA